jgi:hypothetical protein
LSVERCPEGSEQAFAGAEHPTGQVDSDIFIGLEQLAHDTNRDARQLLTCRRHDPPRLGITCRGRLGNCGGKQGDAFTGEPCPVDDTRDCPHRGNVEVLQYGGDKTGRLAAPVLGTARRGDRP